MYGPLATLFHIELREKFKKLGIPADSSLWPKSWKEVVFKEYSRMPFTPLPQTNLSFVTLNEVLQKRKSTRKFSQTKTISLEDLSAILFHSAGINRNIDNLSKSQRSYPSGGARYPLELYVVSSKVDGLEKGLYHYSVERHGLEKLADETINKGFREEVYSWTKDAAVLIIITAVFNRNFMKYGDYGYKIMLMEAGHLAQNIQLVSENQLLSYCSFVGFDEERIDTLIDIGKKRDEFSLYITAIGQRVQ